MKNRYVFFTDNIQLSLLAFGTSDVLECNETNCLNLLSKFLEKHKNDYRFGFLSYNLKNEIVQLKSENTDYIGFPTIGFFVPKYVVQFDKNDNPTFLKGEKDPQSEQFISDFLKQKEIQPQNKIELTSKLTKTEYISTVEELQKDIQNGTIEGINFCQDFFAKDKTIAALPTFFSLNKIAKAPFSCFVSWEDKYLLSASPERFIKLEGNKLITQPIKGTAKRGETPEEDERLKINLQTDKKERAENSMTAHLVEKELIEIAEKDTVKIDELCGVYTFGTVHQLISTISATIGENMDFASLLKGLFPMGSMAGVPKLAALELIDKYENFNRGLYSGSVGYFKPNGDFDFNVVIRSVLYNDKTKNISCPVGGAITAKAVPEKEFEECLIKVDALKKVLNIDA